MSEARRADLDGQVAIVTGAGRGIGRAVALRLAAEGATIVVGDLVARAAETAAAEILSNGAHALAIEVDTGCRIAVDGMVARALGQFGRVDILVNSAGIARHAPFLETTQENWEDHIRINLSGIFNCSQAAAKIMVGARYGRIISISSVAGLMGPIDLASYGAAKAGVIGLTRAMALELGEYGITSNAIAPGPIDTELLRQGWSPEAFAERASQIPAGRLGTVYEIAHAVSMLASPEAGYISGVVLPVDGGSVAAGAYMVEKYRREKAAGQSDA